MTARGARPRSNQGPPVHVGHGRSRPLGDETGSGDVPVRQPALLDEGVEPAVGDVREGERRRAHRARDPDLLPEGPCPRGDRPARQRHLDHEVGQLVLVGGVIGRSFERRRAVGGGGERARSWSGRRRRRRPAGRRREPDRDAEERDAVRVVDRAVDRIDDPDPAAARRGRLAGRRSRARRIPRRGSRRPGSAPGSRR